LGDRYYGEVSFSEGVLKIGAVTGTHNGYYDHKPFSLFIRWIKIGALVAVAALEVDVAAAQEDVDSLADAVEQVVWSGVYGMDALKFAADELGAFLAHELTLALLPWAAGDGCARLQDVKAGGAGLLGHQRTSRPKVPERFGICSA
jgi:hypothetical protein